MDGAKIHIAVNSLLECSVCLQVFQDPRILPCGHTFCLPCLQKTSNRLCPLCKREWTLPTSDTCSLPKNFTVENFIASLPSVSHCAVEGNDSHGTVKYFCIDCWDPLCEECGQAHNKHKMTKHHVIKKLNKVDQSDIELHNRQKTLLCLKHKDKLIEFHCINCEMFTCSSCYILNHNKHDCISVEEADIKLLLALEDLAKKTNDKIKVNEELIKTSKLSKETLEDNKNKLLETVTSLISEVKRTLQVEYEKIVSKVDESYENVVKVIIEKTEEEKTRVNQVLSQTQVKLQSFQEAMLSLKKQMSPLSTAVERASFLKDNAVTQLTIKLEITNNFLPSYQLSDIRQWKADIYNWLQSFQKMLSQVNDLPLISSKEVIITSQIGFVHTQYIKITGK